LVAQHPLQEDYSLGEPDWTQVIETTALDLSQLLPTKKELLQLIGILGGSKVNPDVAQELWKEMEEDIAQKHLNSAGEGSKGCSSIDLSNMSMYNVGEVGEQSMKATNAGGKRMAQELKAQAAQARNKLATRSESMQKNLYKVVHSADALLLKYQVCDVWSGTVGNG
jgi:hypothetical protein